MRKILLLVLLGAFLMSCTGDQGPVGPSGPSGSTIIYVIGVLSAGYYQGDWIVIESDAIRPDAVTQVYVSRDHLIYTWKAVDFELANMRVWFQDASREYLGWEYMIMVIPPTGG